MNIYDFDNTIYEGDTFVDIIKYSFVRHPFKVLKSSIKTIKYYNQYKKNNISFEIVKETLLSFLFTIKDREDYINNFINKNKYKIKDWYKNNQKNDDIIISASYDIWIRPFCEAIGIKNVIATKTDENGKIIGKNCKRKEKVKRLYNEYPDIIVNESYSDSSSDIPMLELGKKSFVVDHNKVYDYYKGYRFKNNN